MFHSVHSQESGELCRDKLWSSVADDLLGKTIRCKGMS